MTWRRGGFVGLVCLSKEPINHALDDDVMVIRNHSWKPIRWGPILRTCRTEYTFEEGHNSIYTQHDGLVQSFEINNLGTFLDRRNFEI